MSAGASTSTPRLTPFRRFSLAMGFGDGPKPDLEPPAAPSSLSEYLTRAKTAFLADSRTSSDKKWTIVLGNEAGDLDSIASSIGYAWFLSEFEKKPAVPLIQIAREDLKLRAENLYALDLAGIHAPADTLLTSSDIPNPSTSIPTNTDFFLVDQNRLAPQFTGTVTGIIDHHQDEGQHTDTASTRTISMCGSCSSLVSLALPAQIPAELATLLFTAIVIDTGGLKPRGKATDEDRQAAAKLIPHSSLSHSSNTTSAPLAPEIIHDAAFIKDLNKELSHRKSDLSHLKGWDLLRRDYKEYSHTLPWMTGSPTIKVGLATVPVALKLWAKDGQLEEASLAWMKHRGLTALGVLTTFTEKKKLKGNKGVHKRQMAWIVHGQQEAEGVSGSGTASLDIAALADKLWEGIEGSSELDVKLHKKYRLERSGKLPPTAKGRVFKQGNASATRKAVAPLIKSILESSPTALPTLSSSQAPPQTAVAAKPGSETAKL